MNAVQKAPVGYLTVWVWLVVLLGIGVAVFAVPLSKATAVVLVFAVAAVKAVLVVRHYMHLREVPLMLYAMVGIPVLLAIGMALTLLPDIAFRP
ncbi:MAG: cytochrome C oxidase subunit IV family protein [Candidatus Binatia bacterium]